MELFVLPCSLVSIFGFETGDKCSAETDRIRVQTPLVVLVTQTVATSNSSTISFYVRSIDLLSPGMI